MANRAFSSLLASILAIYFYGESIGISMDSPSIANILAYIKRKMKRNMNKPKLYSFDVFFCFVFFTHTHKMCLFFYYFMVKQHSMFCVNQYEMIVYDFRLTKCEAYEIAFGWLVSVERVFVSVRSSFASDMWLCCSSKTWLENCCSWAVCRFSMFMYKFVAFALDTRLNRE